MGLFQICAGNRVDNSGMLQLLLGSAYKEPRPFLLLIPLQERRLGDKELGGDNQDS